MNPRSIGVIKNQRKFAIVQRFNLDIHAQTRSFHLILFISAELLVRATFILK